MSPRQFAIVLLGAALTCRLFAAPMVWADDPPKPPNVVLILADDQSYRDFGFLGNSLVHTPRLDELARRSARYPNGYVPMSVCRPSLATLLTGLYPHQHGVHFNHPPPGLSAMRQMSAAEYHRTRSTTDELIRSVKTLPRVLTNHGYACLQTGKHWEGDFRLAGFTHGMTLGLPHVRESSITGTRKQSNGEMVAHGNGDAGLIIGRETMSPITEFLDRYSGRQPFFVWYAPFLPHTPFDAPDRFRKLYQDKPIPDSMLPYYAEIARFDETVGTLLDQLEQHGVAEETLIVFASDNGFRPDEARPSRQNQRSKLSPFEDGLKTPILLHWPEKTQPATHEQLVSTVDLVPTVLNAVGLGDEVTTRMRGINLMPSATGERELPQRPAVGAIYPNDAARLGAPGEHVRCRWIRDGDYKLLVPGPAKPAIDAALFDLAEDPGETQNLISKPEHQSRIAAMRRELDRWWNGQDEDK